MFDGHHEYLLAVYGVLVWYAILFSMQKDKVDKSEKKISFRKILTSWWAKNNDNVFVTMLFAPLTVIFDDEILAVYNQMSDDPLEGVNNLVYISAGPLVSVIFIGIKKLLSK